MPEVIEVCLTAQFLNSKFANKILNNIFVLAGRYTRHPLVGLSEFRGKLDNKTPPVIKNINSKGKFLWFELDNGQYILNHLGLQGEWGLDKRTHSNIKLEITNPKNNKKYELYFSDPRNFGTIEIIFEKSSLDQQLDQLGPDFLKQDFTNQDFHNRIKKYLVNKSRENKPIIKILMDQNKKTGLGSGIGNYLSAEILYMAEISPYTKIINIYSNRELSDKLAYSIKYILKLAYETAEIGYLEHLDPQMGKFIKKIRADKKYNFHPDIKLKKGDIFVFKIYRQSEDPLGNKVLGSKIIPGRTTYWVPAVQK